MEGRLCNVPHACTGAASNAIHRSMALENNVKAQGRKHATKRKPNKEHSSCNRTFFHRVSFCRTVSIEKLPKCHGETMEKKSRRFSFSQCVYYTKLLSFWWINPRYTLRWKRCSTACRSLAMERAATLHSRHCLKILKLSTTFHESLFTPIIYHISYII